MFLSVLNTYVCALSCDVKRMSYLDSTRKLKKKCWLLRYNLNSLAYKSLLGLASVFLSRFLHRAQDEKTVLMSCLRKDLPVSGQLWLFVWVVPLTTLHSGLPFSSEANLSLFFISKLQYTLSLGRAVYSPPLWGDPWAFWSSRVAVISLECGLPVAVSRVPH